MPENSSSKRNELIKKIERVESQLQRESSESRSWNSGKYKNTSQAQMSKILVESRRKELAKLCAALEELDNKVT